jgi:hypothetical protein
LLARFPSQRITEAAIATQDRAAEPHHGKRRTPRTPEPITVTTEITYLSGPHTAHLAGEQTTIIMEVLRWFSQHSSNPSSQ